MVVCDGYPCTTLKQKASGKENSEFERLKNIICFPLTLDLGLGVALEIIQQ